MIDTILDQYTSEKFSSIQDTDKDMLENSSDILIFGAGNNGKRIANLLVSKGHPLAGFIDETPSKQGGKCEGFPIYSAEAAAQIFGNGKNILAIVSIFNPFHSFRRTRKKLCSYGWHCFSILNFARLFSKEFIPFYFLGHPQEIFSHKKEYQDLYNLLIDERSKQELVAHLNFRLKLDFDGLPEPVGLNFSYLENRLPPDIYFIDGGAFDGDTVRAFLGLVNDQFSKIAALEPDPANFSKLKAFRQSLSIAIKNKIDVMNVGLWSQDDSLGFHSTATAGSYFSADAPNKITVISVDEHFKTTSPLLLKLDVEGAERNAIYGAKRFLQEGRSIVIVAVYHQPDDLHELPKLIHSFNSGYRFGLRSHGDDGADLMLYAFPPGTL